VQHSFFDKYSDLESVIHRLDPRTKFLCLVLYVLVVVTTPPGNFHCFAAYAAVISLAIFISRIPPVYVLKRSALIIPFGVLTAAFLPFWKVSQGDHLNDLTLLGQTISRDGLMILWNVVIKSWLAALAMILLSASTRFPSLLKGLESMRFPRVMLMILSFMYRYIFVIVDEAQRMQRARASRCVSGNNWRTLRASGNIIGLLFIRAYERAERVYRSMVSRGFEGEIKTLNHLRFSVGDVLFALPFVGFTIAGRFWSA
jgi:cobalt/nickel transport system permease protein